MARDAAVVWHGFTQMAAYPDNAPVTVERAEGRELIDVHGHRYFDAISSLWVTTLGHHVPELDAAVVDQLGKVAHATLLGQREPGRRGVRRGPGRGGPGRRRPRALRLRRCGGRRAGAQDRLPVLGQPGASPADRRFLALGDAYHGDTVGALSLGDGGFGTTVFDPLRFPVVRTPGYASAGLGRPRRWPASRPTPTRWPPWSSSRWCRGRRASWWPSPRTWPSWARPVAPHGVLLICDEVATGFGRTGRLFASEWAGPGFRPDLLCLGKGITGGYLPLSATVASGPVFEAFDGADLGRATFYHGHSYGGNALACAVALRHLQLLDEWDVLANVAGRRGTAGHAASTTTVVGPTRAWRARPAAGLMVGVELAPPRGRRPAGVAGSAPARCGGGCCCGRSGTWW